MNIIEPTMDYDFKQLSLCPPATLSGGSYFTKIVHGTNLPLYIQTPKCITKQGFIKSGKKMYVDLMFDNNDTIFINWMENLENKCQELLLSKSDVWFEGKIEKEDIENAFSPIFKLFKSGKYYLLRANVRPTIKIMDETNNNVQIENIKPEMPIISVLEIQGIKFTARNFQIELEVRQSVTVSPDPFLETCFIKIPNKSNKQDNSNMSINDNNSKNNIDATTLTNNIVNINTNLLDIKDKIDNNNIQIDHNNNHDNDNDNDDTVVNNTTNDNTILNEKTSIINLELNDEDISVSNIDEFIKETAKELVSSENKTLETINDNKEENIFLDVEELPLTLEETNSLIEIEPSFDSDLEKITLKKPNEVYEEIYNKAKEKALEAKQIALNAYAELKNIKQLYMIEDKYNSDDESNDEFEIESLDV
jgi:hypothetical protein